MDGYVVHTEDGIYLGAFFSFREANSYAYQQRKSGNKTAMVSKEKEYRKKFLRDTGLEMKVLNRTLEFLSR